jgi:hypothetical protein
MRSMRSMRGGIIFRNRGPSLKVHHGQCLASMTKHDTDVSPPGAECESAKLSHDKTQGSTSGCRSRLSPHHFPGRHDYYSLVPRLSLRGPLQLSMHGLQDATLCQVKLDGEEDQPVHQSVSCARTVCIYFVWHFPVKSDFPRSAERYLGCESKGDIL